MNISQYKLIEQLVHGNEIQSCLAAQAMGFSEDDIYLPFLIRELSKNPSKAAYRTIIEAIGKYDRDSAIYALVEASKNCLYPELREFLIATLGEQTETYLPYRQCSSVAIQDSVKFLLECLQDSDFSIIEASLNSLGRIGSDSAISGIYEIILSQPEKIKQKAADALMRFEGEKFLSVIREGLSNPDSRVRYALANAINRYLDELDVGEHKIKGWLREVGRGRSRRENSIDIIVNILEAHSKDLIPDIQRAILEALKRIYRILTEVRNRGTTFRYADDDDDDGGERYPEEGMTSVTEDRIRNAIQEVRPSQSLERYADLRLFNDDLTDQIDSVQRLEALQWYQLEAAIRKQAIGLPLDQEERHAIQEPRQTKDVRIYITAEPDGFDIEQPISTLILPAKGDSIQNPCFRIRPKTELIKGSIRLRFFYDFNLLEEVIFQAFFVPRFSGIEEFLPGDERRGASTHRYDREAPNIFFRQNKFEQDYVDFDDVLPRSMHINVSSRGDNIVFTFTFLNESCHQVQFTSITPFDKTELEDCLVRMRKVWASISLSETFTSQLESGKQEFTSVIRKLAEVGNFLWVKLFRFDVDSAIFLVGEWLREHPLPDGSLIQVSTDFSISNFSFPWSLLYDRELPDKDYDLPDLNGFWGTRYCIEQQIPGHKRHTDVFHTSQPIRLDYFRWEQFRNIEKQDKLINSLIESYPDQLLVSEPPIITARKGYKVLEDGNSNILYFYAHGYTRLRESAQENDRILSLFVEDFCKKLEREKTLLGTTYKSLCDAINKGEYEFKDSWIELSSGKLYLSNLYSKPIRFKSAPFVFLNLCESAQIVPSLSDSFIHFFINRGAESVIGTECPMTIEFAHPFSEFLLKEVLSGKSVGNALLNARRHFLERHANPLGLAYTLFGKATCRFSLS